MHDQMTCVKGCMPLPLFHSPLPLNRVLRCLQVARKHPDDPSRPLVDYELALLLLPLMLAGVVGGEPARVHPSTRPAPLMRAAICSSATLRRPVLAPIHQCARFREGKGLF